MQYKRKFFVGVLYFPFQNALSLSYTFGNYLRSTKITRLEILFLHPTNKRPSYPEDGGDCGGENEDRPARADASFSAVAPVVKVAEAPGHVVVVVALGVLGKCRQNKKTAAAFSNR